MTDIQTIFQSIRCVLCLNGEIPNPDFFLKCANIPLFACDGAGSRLIKQGVYPNLISGDLDSLDHSIVPAEIEIKHTPDQNYTDLEKALNILIERKLFPCLITGTTGREIDHTINNINVILKYSQNHPILFHDSAYTDKEKFGIFVFDSLIGNFEANTKISILPYPKATVSSKGLKWNLDKDTLSQDTKSSALNVVQISPIEITVHNGVVLVLFDK